ncbi:MAG: hypothetical protein A4E57_03297 [Syntrophorhabdaceae bacterium PtaU1.Bin034]|jgi:hypothetical protein|nr:MAG: hypothetical protein A4E57_03297 [Syntrophorhabdaceae bacterium PtaU1.Bin034]
MSLDGYSGRAAVTAAPLKLDDLHNASLDLGKEINGMLAELLAAAWDKRVPSAFCRYRTGTRR